MTKKNIKVKKNNGKGDISITIENNLNANNKQINHQPIKRRRRKKKVENTDEESLKEQPLPKLKDTSYIKPGPVGNFQIWRDNMDSYNTTIPMNQAQQLGIVPPRLPPPTTPLALPAPPSPAPPTPATPAPTPATPDFGVPTYEAFAKVLSAIAENQRNSSLSPAPPPPSSWGRNLVDDDVEPDDDDNRPGMPASPAFSRASKPSDLDYDMDFENELENQIAEVYNKDVKDPEVKEVGKEMQQILNKARIATETIQAKRLGTLHANKNWAPRGKYKDTEAYQIAYNTVLNKKKNNDDVIPISARTRAQTKKASEEIKPKKIIFDDQDANDVEAILEKEIEKSENLMKDLDNSNANDIDAILKKEIAKSQALMKDLDSWGQNFNVEKELAKAGLKRLVMTNEDEDELATQAGMLFRD